MRLRVTLLALLVAAAAAAGWWWFAPEDAGAQLRRGRGALAAGDFDAAEHAARQLGDAGHADHARLLRGELLLRQARYADALAELNEVRDEGELRSDAAALVGQCLLQLNNAPDAERAFAFLLNRRPDSVDAHRGLAAACFDLGAFSRAVTHAERWAELDPRDGRPHRLIGLMYKELGQYPQAVGAYRIALGRELKEHVAEEVRQELADCLIRLGEFGDALAVLEIVIPPEALAANNLALRAECLRNLGEPGRARELAGQALALKPDTPLALRVRGKLLLEAGDAKAAVAPLERAARLAPEQVENQHLLAEAYARAGDDEAAARQRRRVADMQQDLDELSKLARRLMDAPRDPELHRRAAALYRRLGLARDAARSERLAATLKQ